MARLPVAFLDTDTLEQMRVGDVRYTTPWGMWVDSDMMCWLHPRYTAARGPGGTVQMRVERREDGYHVWPPADERYQPTDSPGFVGEVSEWLPVAEVHET